jgi:hypothetical protein
VKNGAQETYDIRSPVILLPCISIFARLGENRDTKKIKYLAAAGKHRLK